MGREVPLRETLRDEDYLVMMNVGGGGGGGGGGGDKGNITFEKYQICECQKSANWRLGIMYDKESSTSNSCLLLKRYFICITN